MKHSWIGVMLVSLAGLGAASAQETTSGSIAGRVVDPQEAPVPGAMVTVTSDQGTRDFITDARGRFYSPYLTPGVYSVRVELTGFSTVERHEVIVHLGQRVQLPFAFEVGTIEEIVQVIGESPVIDMTSTTAGEVLDSERLKGLPVGRRFTETLYMVPGVSNSSGVGNANPSIAGASGLENHYLVDGLNITNVGFGGIGAYTPGVGSLGLGVTTDFIKETQVKTAGFQAEYGQATGGIVSVITKSGTNLFHGSLFGYWSPIGLQSSWRQLQTVNGVVNTTSTETLDVGVSAGGPLVRDRLFFFAAFNPQYDTRTLIAPGDFPLRSLGETDRSRRALSYAAKLTWQVSSSHRLDLSAFGDPSYGGPGPQNIGTMLRQDTGGFGALRYGGRNVALRYNGVLTNRWLIEGFLGHAATYYEDYPSVDETRVTDYTAVPFRRSGGRGWYLSGADGSNLQMSLKSTNLFNAGGRHELRYGVQWEDIDFALGWALTGPQYTFANAATTIGGSSLSIHPDPSFGQIYRRWGFVGELPVTKMKYLSGFVQDSWQVGARLTIRPGLRWERQHIIGGTPICYDDEERVGDGGSGNGNPILCEYTWADNWAPRLGAVFDLRGDGKAKLFASVGRFYVKMPNDLAARAMSTIPTVRADFFDEAGTQPVPEGVRAVNTTRHLRESTNRPALFANDTRLTFTDELIAGFDFEAAAGLSLGVRYIHRDISTVLEDYAQAQPLLYDIGYEGLDQVEYIIDNISADLVTIDPTDAGIPQAFFEDPVHTYDAIEITANKVYSGNWSLFASYRWSHLKGNFEGFFRSDNGQSDPALTSLFDFPTNDVSYTQIGAPMFGYQGDIRYLGTTLGEGRLPNDRPHQLKLYGTWSRGNLNLGAGVNVGSGRLLTQMAALPIYGSIEVPMALRGSGFETADGFRERASADILFDVHVDYVFPVGGRRLQLIADVFNLLNNREPTYYDYQYEYDVGVPNPDFGQPAYGRRAWPSYRTPRSVRLGARFEW